MLKELLIKCTLLLMVPLLLVNGFASAVNISNGATIEHNGASPISPVAASTAGSAVVFYTQTPNPMANVSFCPAGNTQWQLLPDLNQLLSENFILDVNQTPKIEMDDAGNILLLLFPIKIKQITVLYFHRATQTWNLTNSLPNPVEASTKQISMKMDPYGHAVLAIANQSSSTLHIGTFKASELNWSFNSNKYPDASLPVVAVNKYGKAVVAFNTTRYTSPFILSPRVYEPLLAVHVDASTFPPVVGQAAPIYSSKNSATVNSKALAISETGNAAILFNVGTSSFLFSIFDGVAWNALDFDNSIPIKIPLFTTPSLSFDPASGNIFAVYCSETSLLCNVFNRCRWTGTTALTTSLGKTYSYTSLIEPSGIGMVAWSEDTNSTVIKTALFSEIKFGNSAYSSLETLATTGNSIFGATPLNGSGLPHSSCTFTWSMPITATNHSYQSAFLNTIEVKATLIEHPTNLTARSFCNKYLSQEDLFAILSWIPPANAIPTSYNIYLDGVFIFNIPGNLDNFEIHNLHKGENTISITSVDANSKESLPAITIVKFGKKTKR